MKHLVFTYGTLQTGERNFEKYMSGAETFGPSRTLEPGFLMGHHKSATSEGRRSPGAVYVGPGGSHIAGELFEVNEEQLALLDRLEDITSGKTYYRKEIAMDDGVIAYAYLHYGEESYDPSPHVHYNEDTNTYRWQEQPVPA